MYTCWSYFYFFIRFLFLNCKLNAEVDDEQMTPSSWRYWTTLVTPLSPIDGNLQNHIWYSTIIEIFFSCCIFLSSLSIKKTKNDQFRQDSSTPLYAVELLIFLKYFVNKIIMRHGRDSNTGTWYYYLELLTTRPPVDMYGEGKRWECMVWSR
jgi:hypothetical protein